MYALLHLLAAAQILTGLVYLFWGLLFLTAGWNGSALLDFPSDVLLPVMAIVHGVAIMVWNESKGVCSSREEGSSPASGG